MLSTWLYPTRVVVVAEDSIVADHARLSDKGKIRHRSAPCRCGPVRALPHPSDQHHAVAWTRSWYKPEQMIGHHRGPKMDLVPVQS
jgi:hypothetical protein